MPRRAAFIFSIGEKFGLELLRESFLKTMGDPEFLKEASKAGLETNPKSGAELERLAQEVIGTSPKAVKRLQKLLE